MRHGTGIKERPTKPGISGSRDEGLGEVTASTVTGLGVTRSHGTEKVSGPEASLKILVRNLRNERGPSRTPVL